MYIVINFRLYTFILLSDFYFYIYRISVVRYRERTLHRFANVVSFINFSINSIALNGNRPVLIPINISR